MHNESKHYQQFNLQTQKSALYDPLVTGAQGCGYFESTEALFVVTAQEKITKIARRFLSWLIWWGKGEGLLSRGVLL